MAYFWPCLTSSFLRSEKLWRDGDVARTSRAGPLTSESWGKRVTNAMKSSQPALRLMGLGERSLSTLAPSLSALTSSNMVSAGGGSDGAGMMGGWVGVPSERATSSVRARMAARGMESWEGERGTGAGRGTDLLVGEDGLVCEPNVEHDDRCQGVFARIWTR